MRHDSRNATRNGTNGSDDSDELRLRHIRPAPHRLTLLKLQQACFDPVKGSEDPVDLSITHTVNDNRRNGLDASPYAVAGQVLSAAFWNSNVRDNTAFVKAETDVVGLKFISSTALSGVTTNISNVFSSTYDSYRVVISGISSATSTVRAVSLRYRTSSDDTTGAYHWYETALYAVGTTSAGGAQSQTSAKLTSTSTFGGGQIVFDVVNPNAALVTTLTGSSFTYQADVGSFVYRTLGSVMNTSTQYTGFSVFGVTDALSGTVKVYGYRNS